ncbi:unnamed protein product [Acanthosepion pharaonis]|uniref:Uncharacterized protein n=1 Tax=Acanthosepion pharaonis TaxID=158019 RepID=A0A812DQ94_ACAPH|nr:unnamed protein product [Sepia pharaonis]
MRRAQPGSLQVRKAVVNATLLCAASQPAPATTALTASPATDKADRPGEVGFIGGDQASAARSERKGDDQRLPANLTTCAVRGSPPPRRAPCKAARIAPPWVTISVGSGCQVCHRRRDARQAATSAPHRAAGAIRIVPKADSAAGSIASAACPSQSPKSSSRQRGSIAKWSHRLGTGCARDRSEAMRWVTLRSFARRRRPRCRPPSPGCRSAQHPTAQYGRAMAQQVQAEARGHAGDTR